MVRKSFYVTEIDLFVARNLSPSPGLPTIDAAADPSIAPTYPGCPIIDYGQSTYAGIRALIQNSNLLRVDGVHTEP